jgi:ATP-dependent Lon protease
MPGRILQEVKRAGSRDPVFMLDEIDKVGSSWRGDPSSALLEVLDPAQNSTFVDNYLNVPFDLSQVLFIATANTLDTVPGPLADRMEVLQLSGYTEQEKLQIAVRYLIPKQLEAHGLALDEVEIAPDALRALASGYTREAGVRNLDRAIATVIRKVARQVAEGGGGRQAATVTITAADLGGYLGKPHFEPEVAERPERPGVATGLAWTPAGGDVLLVEATVMPGDEDRLILTGMLGEVMRESAQAALSFLRSNAGALGIDPEKLLHRTVHVHVPAGAVPKDGPSAGVTILTALASIASRRPVKPGLAMTGEITLRGRVLPVGGIKEKVLAAHRAGIREVLLPSRNQRDLEDVPKDLLAEMSITGVDTADEVLSRALV